MIGVTIGTDNRLNYTLLGDAVNVASRVEQLNKQFRTRILATESTVRPPARPTASGWARSTCAATRTTSSSTASGRRHDHARDTDKIAAIRRRYLLMATSVVVIDIAFALVFFVLYDAWSFAPRSLGGGLVLLLGVNYVVSSRLFAPIERYLKGAMSFEDTQRRITQLPLLTAQSVGDLDPRS